MDVYTNEKTLLRIYMSENDRYGGNPLSAALCDLFAREGYSGAAVLKGIAGFGLRSDREHDLSSGDGGHVPVIVELIACRGRIDLIMPRICEMMDSGMITMETVKVARRRTAVKGRGMHGYLQ